MADIDRDFIKAAISYPLSELAAVLNGRVRDRSRHSRRKAPERPPDGLLTPAEAAARLRITEEQLSAFVRDGELRYVNMGRGTKRPRYRFTEADIFELIEKRKEQDSKCLSSDRKSPLRTTGTTSKSVVVGFMDRRAAQIAAKRKK